MSPEDSRPQSRYCKSSQVFCNAPGIEDIGACQAEPACVVSHDGIFDVITCRERRCCLSMDNVNFRKGLIIPRLQKVLYSTPVLYTGLARYQNLYTFSRNGVASILRKTLPSSQVLESQFGGVIFQALILQLACD